MYVSVLYIQLTLNKGLNCVGPLMYEFFQQIDQKNLSDICNNLIFSFL